MCVALKTKQVSPPSYFTKCLILDQKDQIATAILLLFYIILTLFDIRFKF